MCFIEIDMLGKQCPMPVVETKKVIDQLDAPAKVVTHVDNEIAVENLKRLADSMHLTPVTAVLADDHFTVTVEVTEVNGSGTEAAKEMQMPELMACTPQHTVCVFASDVMGHGDDVLGKILIKGFIYALSQMESLPETCLFYNGGAKLTASDSESLADLRVLEEAGVNILTCGTCADFYGIKDKIAVGSITNMYDIVERMTQATKIIKP